MAAKKPKDLIGGKIKWPIAKNPFTSIINHCAQYPARPIPGWDDTGMPGGSLSLQNVYFRGR
jgi:hypothetical protein